MNKNLNLSRIVAPGPTASIIYMSATCFGLLLMRILISNKASYLFLIWNLILALVPLVLALLAQKISKINSGTLLIVVIFLWFIFFPNAPYIVTDFIHLRPRPYVPLWYDAGMLFTFAITGLLAGLASLLIIHKILMCFMKEVLSWLMVIFISILSAYGVYIGRVLRYNSWNVFNDPINLLNDLAGCMKENSALAMTFMFSVLILFPYLILFQKSSE